MKPLYALFCAACSFFSTNSALAQTNDSTQNTTHFYGSVGITTNGFSIIPSFSLNSPAVIATMAWRKRRFSFDPDIRLVPDGTKGGALFWLRYRVVEKRKFGLRLGVHPALNLVRKTVVDAGVNRKITELLRFLAFEIVPSYQISPHFGVSAVYLQGHGLQSAGPQFTNVLFLNAAITNIPLGPHLSGQVYPSVFFLQTDGYRGDYLTLTGVLAHAKWPFSLQSTINQTLQSDVPGNRRFMWNVALNFNFNRHLKKVKA